MVSRYDILTVRESNGKSYFTKLGAMFPNKSGDGFSIVLDGVPASVDGQYRLIAKEPRETDGGQRRQSADADRADARGRAGGRFDDDELPPF